MKQAIALLILLALHAAILWHSATQKSASVDELSHLATGLYTLETLDFRINRTAPPFQNIANALPVFCFADYALSFDNENWKKGIWNGVGDRLVEENPETFHQLLMLGRTGTMALSAALCLLVFVWSKRLWGAPVAWILTVIAALEPNALAHGRLATTDTAPTLLFLLSGFMLWIFFQKPNWLRLAGLGAAFGLTWLSKHSGATLLPAFAAALLIAAALKNIDAANFLPMKKPMSARWKNATALAVMMTVIATAGLFVIWAGYGFEIGDTIEGPRKPAHSYIWNELQVPAQTMLNLFGLGARITLDPADEQNPMWLALRGALPAFSHWEGFFANRSHIKTGHLGFFMGTLSSHGWRSYYPVLFLIKTPVALLAIFAAGAALLASRWVRLDWSAWLSLSAIPLVYGAVLIFFNTANIGYRHALPLVPYFIILFGGAASSFIVECAKAAYARAALPDERRDWFEKTFRGALVPKALAGLFIGAMLIFIVDSISIHPNYLSYFNAVIGGPNQGHHYAVDSNLDWGQDLILLKRYLEARGIEEVRLLYFGPQNLPALYGVPHIDAKIPKTFEPGTYAVSASLLHGIGAGGMLPRLAVFQKREPDEMVTPGLFIYHLP